MKVISALTLYLLTHEVSSINLTQRNPEEDPEEFSAASVDMSMTMASPPGMPGPS